MRIVPGKLFIWLLQPILVLTARPRPREPDASTKSPQSQEHALEARSGERLPRGIDIVFRTDFGSGTWNTPDNRQVVFERWAALTLSAARDIRGRIIEPWVEVSVGPWLPGPGVTNPYPEFVPEIARIVTSSEAIRPHASDSPVTLRVGTTAMTNEALQDLVERSWTYYDFSADASSMRPSSWLVSRLVERIPMVEKSKMALKVMHGSVSEGVLLNRRTGKTFGTVRPYVQLFDINSARSTTTIQQEVYVLNDIRQMPKWEARDSLLMNGPRRGALPTTKNVMFQPQIVSIEDILRLRMLYRAGC